MATINLLPWREEERKERQRQFLRITGGAACLTLAVVAYAWLHLDANINAQNRRVDYLAKVSQEYDKKIEQISNIELEEEQLKQRISVIETLQASRPEIVKVFSELARSLPDGLYLTVLENQGPVITVGGFAESNATVSSFMRQLDESSLFKESNLGGIESVVIDKQRLSKFTLKVLRADPEAPDSNANPNDKAVEKPGSDKV
mgnify:CR=1 FL=1